MNDDVWRHICTFLSPETLRDVAKVHPVFYEQWMKHKYRRIELSRGDKLAKRFWEHLECVPSPIFELQSGLTVLGNSRGNKRIGSSVKCVVIKPWSINPRSMTYQGRTRRLLQAFAMLCDPDYTKAQLQKKIDKRLDKDTKRVDTLFSTMVNVQEYHIDWDQDPTHHALLFRSFLKSGLESWRDTLTHLALHIPLEHLATLARITLPSLCTFNIQFTTLALSLREINIYLDGFMVFLHNLKDTLTSLSISSNPRSEHLDLSRFFRYLGSFPHLREMGLKIPFDGGQLSDPHTLCNFIARHTHTLRSLSLQTTRCAVHSSPVAPESAFWIQTVLSTLQSPSHPHSPAHPPLPAFPELRSLTLALRPLKAPLDLISTFLRAHAGTLEHLALLDRTLDLYDLRTTLLPPLLSRWPVLDLRFLAPLKSLEMRVDRISPHLLILLAQELPGLRKLRLEPADRGMYAVVSTFSPISVAQYMSLTLPATQERFEEYLDRHQFGGANWKLEQLEIVSSLSSASTTTGRMQLQMHQILSSRVPGLESVNEVGPASL